MKRPEAASGRLKFNLTRDMGHAATDSGESFYSSSVIMIITQTICKGDWRAKEKTALKKQMNC